jgi:BirA family biotin operon repressor/biotin-[acetyl-CoA-carboxylase] ligase
LALVAGLALADAIGIAAPEVPILLKWPNDVMLGRGKLAGILLERAGDRVVVGFGINLAVTPAIDDRPTSSLSDKGIAPEAFAPLLAGSFARLLAAWRITEPASLARSWAERAHPRGTPLTVHNGSGDVVDGIFDGIEADGALRLSLADGRVEVIRAGDVSLANPVPKR